MPAYVTATVLKTTLGIGSTYADADVVVAVDAASRACDGYKNLSPNMFSPLPQVRYYTGAKGDDYINIDPLSTLSAVAVDTSGAGTYDTTWAVNTDFALEPINAASDGIPYRQLQILPQSGRTFPGYLNSVRITGTFGWGTTPPAVTQATSILAGRLLKRSRETPYGIVVVAGDAVAAARLGRIDPDVAFLLDNLPGTVPLLAV